MNIANLNVSTSIKQRLKEKDMTLEDCCKAFNNKHKEEILNKLVRPLNKDFLSRATRGNFKVLNERILKLCEFLEIKDPQKIKMHSYGLFEQINQFETLAKKNPTLKERFPQILTLLEALKLNSSGANS